MASSMPAMCGAVCAPGAPGPPPATPVVVDTDLGGDDLVALGFLLRHPGVEVEAVTVAGTGLVGCAEGVDLVADLVTALRERPVPVACGREDAGAEGRAFPGAWRDAAAAGSGLPRSDGTLTARAVLAPELVGRVAARTRGLVVVELGPMTNLADLASSSPRSYGRIARVWAMGGSVDGPLVDGVAEWNAAADPASFRAVLDAGVPVTVVPEDVVPDGTPAALAAAPVLGDVAATVGYPRWWDLAAAAALVTPEAVETSDGEWVLDGPGRLQRVGPGQVRVVRSLAGESLEASYARAFLAG
jgi:hypothetical protein